MLARSLGGPGGWRSLDAMRRRAEVRGERATGLWVNRNIRRPPARMLTKRTLPECSLPGLPAQGHATCTAEQTVSGCVFLILNATVPIARPGTIGTVLPPTP